MYSHDEEEELCRQYASLTAKELERAAQAAQVGNWRAVAHSFFMIKGHADAAQRHAVTLVALEKE